MGDAAVSVVTALSKIEGRLSGTSASDLERKELIQIYSFLSYLLTESEITGASRTAEQIHQLVAEICEKIGSEYATSEGTVGQLEKIRAELAGLLNETFKNSRSDRERRGRNGLRGAIALDIGATGNSDDIVGDGDARRGVERARTFAAALLIFFVAPFASVILVGLYFCITEGRIADGTFLELVKAMATNPGLYSGALQWLLVPSAAALTGASILEARTSRGLAGLLGISIGGTVLCGVGSVMFTIGSDLDQSMKGAVSSFFVSSGDALVVYVMWIVGLGMRLRL